MVPALVVLALGAFTLGTSELGVAGLLPALGADLAVSAGTAGTLVSVYAVAVVVAGPVGAILLRRAPRRRVLLGALGALAVGNGATALATGLPLLLAARAFTGAAAAVYAVTALATATALVGPERRGRAVAVVFGGITASGVVGVPASTLLGDVVGWRGVYGGLSALAVAVLAAAAVFLPPASGRPLADSASRFLRRARSATAARGRMPYTFLGNALVTAGHYTASTYFVVLLTRRTDLAPATAALVLLTGGVAATIGNAVGGAGADRRTRRTLLATAASLAGCLAVVPLVMAGPVLTWLVSLVWAAAFSAFSTAAQAAVDRQAGPGAPLAGAVNISVFNVGIALGSALGGGVLHRAGFTGVHLVGAALVALGLVSVLHGRPRDLPRTPGAGTEVRGEVRGEA
ncbi:MFS transporter [Streptomyces liangshanensis]|uniref:MFS transporter n=1 Tax=Streptomyces liangshanensis TaxID=2717324 RepID=A0A6G9GVU6_9ACTN|nr:MFS transporter [Streptomyces liangshanensis]QIQ02330.1 MFS transporter [Streptomyces liangshanensis]